MTPFLHIVVAHNIFSAKLGLSQKQCNELLDDINEMKQTRNISDFSVGVYNDFTRRINKE